MEHKMDTPIIDTHLKCALCGEIDDHDRVCPIRVATEVAYRRPVDFSIKVKRAPTFGDKLTQWWISTFG